MNIPIENLVIELKGEEIKIMRDALATCKMVTPRDGSARLSIASLSKRLTEALENPEKHHAYRKPRVMPWMEKL